MMINWVVQKLAIWKLDADDTGHFDWCLAVTDGGNGGGQSFVPH